MSQILKKILALILCVSFLVVPAKKANAEDAIMNLRDVTSSMTPMVTANHTITFGINPSSAPVVSTDFIIINLPMFSSLSVPTNIVGSYTGSPEFSIVGHDIRITGININPGDNIGIYGIMADNPELDQDFYGYLKIGSYQGGYFNERINERFIPIARPGYILVRARIDRSVASLQIKGFAPPGMYLTLVESSDSSVILGTAVATWNGTVGEFTINVPSIEPADQTHSFMLSGTDSDGNLTPTIVIEEFMPSGMKVIVSNVLMPPTIDISSNSALPSDNGVLNIQRGDRVDIHGIAIPNSTVQIMTEPPYESFSTTTDSEGRYFYSFGADKTQDMEYGDHKVNSFVTYANKSLVSTFSFTKFFKVVKQENPDKPPCDISKGDLNCDTKVDLIDFSILLYFWGTNSVKADINNDQKVNLIDFSIMMFYWEG